MSLPRARSGRRRGTIGRATATVATAVACLSAIVGIGVLSAIPASAKARVTTVHQCQRAAKGYRSCFALRQVKQTAAGDLVPNATTSPTGLAPADIQGAYKLPGASAGTGKTVAIVDAYDLPTAEADLATYRSQFGLPACTTANGCFKKVSQTGSTTSLPTADAGWGGEIALDLDMVSATCPGCNILLVEANSASDANLGTAVNRAVAMGAVAVSNSYGGPESSSDTSYDTSYYKHPGVAITASSGDDGYGTSYPSDSPWVTSVGGTSLKRDTTTARGWTESVWGSAANTNGGAGSGCSVREAKPSFQTDTGCTKRTMADVSAVADPQTGVSVYDSYGSGAGWNVYGGTSASSPIIASVYAMATAPTASAFPNSYPYANRSALNDVTSGTNGSCGGSYLCTAGVGYDGPTGLGTPNGLTAFGPSTTAPANDFSVAASPTSGTVTAGSSTTTSVATATTSGSAQSVALSASGLPAGVTASFSPTSVTSGGSSTLTLNTTSATAAGTYTITVTGTATSGTHTTTYSLKVNAASTGGSCTAAQKVANGGFESNGTSWTQTSGVIGAYGSSEPTHAGTYDAWLDGYGSTHTDTLSQSIAIPSGCTTYSLSFYLHIDTAETTTSTQYDKLTVTLGSTTLATYSNLNKASGYVLRTFNVSGLAGQTVTLKFAGSEDSSLQTSFVVDDVALNVS